MKPFIGGRASVNIWSYLPPKTPTGISVVDNGTNRAYNNGSADVSFTPVADSGPTLYYQATSSPGGFTAVSSTSPINVTGLQTGVSYTFKVKAIGYSSNGDSAESAASSAITATTIPQVPTIGTASDVGISRGYSDAAATVTFTPGATGGKTTTYEVYSSQDSSILVGSSLSSPVTASSLVAQTTQSFRVQARNANGSSQASSFSNSVALTSTPIGPAVSITPSSTVWDSLDVSWNFYGGTGGKTLTATTVRIYLSGTGTLVATQTLAGDVTTATFTAVTPGTYYALVAGTNANGLGSFGSSGSTATITTTTTTTTTPAPNYDIGGSLAVTSTTTSSITGRFSCENLTGMAAVIYLTTSAGTISPTSSTVQPTGVVTFNWTVSGLSPNQSATIYWTSSQSNRFGSGSITSSSANTTSPPATSAPATSAPATTATPAPCSTINLSNCVACGGAVYGGVCAI